MLEILVQQLLSEDIEKCKEAVQRVGEMARDGDDISTAIPSLLKLLNHANGSTRVSVLWALGYTANADVVEPIRTMLRQEERRSDSDRNLDVIDAARTAMLRLENARGAQERETRIKQLEIQLEHERNKPRQQYSTIVHNADTLALGIGDGKAEARKDLNSMKNDEQPRETNPLASNTATANASGGSTAIATAGNNNLISTIVTQSQGDTQNWLKAEMLKWLQKADKSVEDKDDLSDVKEQIKRIVDEIDKHGEQADQNRIEKAFMKIWNLSKDVGTVILSGLGGPISVVQTVAHLIEKRINQEQQT
jgi:hypothetical protein